MKVITEETVCAGILREFLDTFQHNSYMDNAREAQYKRLKALPELTKETIIEIVPEFESRFLHTCSECNGKYSTVIEVGEYLDYESRTAWLCKHCINNAMKLIHPGPPV